MAATFSLRILTPEREFFSGDVTSLIVEVPDGQLGILASHAPLVAPIVISTAKIHDEWGLKEAFLSEGFIEIREHGDTFIFTQAAEWPEEIDVNRATAAKNRAERMLRKQHSVAEKKLYEVSLSRAVERLRIKRLP